MIIIGQAARLLIDISSWHASMWAEVSMQDVVVAEKRSVVEIFYSLKPGDLIKVVWIPLRRCDDDQRKEIEFYWIENCTASHDHVVAWQISAQGHITTNKWVSPGSIHSIKLISSGVKPEALHFIASLFRLNLTLAKCIADLSEQAQEARKAFFTAVEL